MPAYNANKRVKAAIESILSQSYSSFDFIITDDGSTDGTTSIINSYRDRRIIFFQNEGNRGVVSTRNSMIDYCLDNDYQYMAIMDADDIAYPKRLEKQVSILDADPILAVCGSSMKIERRNTVWFAPEDSASIKAGTVFGNQIPTSTATMRLRYLRQFNLRWDESYAPCADYHLWYKMLFVHNLRANNTGDIDMLYTYSPNGVSHGKGLIEQEKKDAKTKQQILSHFGIDSDFKSAMSFMRIALFRSDQIEDAQPFLKIASQLINNKSQSPVDHAYLSRCLSHRVSAYLSKVPKLPKVIELELIEMSSLTGNIDMLQGSFENSLRKLKFNYLDKWAPNISWVLTSFYFNLKKYLLTFLNKR